MGAPAAAGVEDELDIPCKELGQGGFDVAILDVNLKGELVWPVAEALNSRGIPFVIASGGHVEPPPADFAKAPLLEKPYTIDRIGPVLEQAAG